MSLRMKSVWKKRAAGVLRPSNHGKDTSRGPDRPTEVLPTQTIFRTGPDFQDITTAPCATFRFGLYVMKRQFINELAAIRHLSAERPVATLERQFRAREHAGFF